VARVRGILQGKDLAEPHAGPEIRAAVLNLMTDPKKYDELRKLAKQAEEALYGPGDARGKAVEVGVRVLPGPDGRAGG
jgi:hypothetical protein